MLTLGIDIGTSGVRTAVLDEADVVSTARVAHLPQDPERVSAEKWWLAVRNCLFLQAEALKEQGRDFADVSGIAVDGTSGSMVLTDAALCPVSPALMYNSKGFEAEAARISECVSGAHITGGSNSALARAMRLVELADRTPVHLLHQADFIAARLMGCGGNSDYNNALKTGFDPGSGHWPDWIAEVVDPSLLPTVHAPGALLKPVDPEVAATFGFSKNTRVHAGTTDSIAAFLASAPLRAGVAVTSLGSTIAIKLLSPHRVDDPSIGLYSHRLGDLWLVGGASNSGGAVLKAYFEADRLGALSAEIDPAQPTGLDYYPLLEPGERFPINDPALPPRLEPRPESDVLFLQAMLEGMARIEAKCYREIEQRGGPYPTELFTAGGGAQNTAWNAIRSGALGLDLSNPRYSEASIGAARLTSGAFA